MQWPESLRDWRNRLLISPTFQERSTRFALTRPMARASATSLFELCTGFVYTQVLLACVELDLFETLRSGPQPTEDLCKKCDLSLDAGRRLFKAAAALKLLERRSGDRIALGFRGAALLGNPSVFEMIRHHAVLYRDLADPVALLRNRRHGTHLSEYWGYADSSQGARLHADDIIPYTNLMAATQAFIAQDVIGAYDFSKHRRLLDLGGGDGSFISAVGAAVPDLEFALLDLPAVAERARTRLAERGLGERVRIHPGDFFNDPLPTDCDAISLVRILHDHDEHAVRALLAKARQALPKHGVLIVAEPMAGTPGAEAMGDAYFGMYLWAMGSGEPRTLSEIEAMLSAAGFSTVKRHKTNQPVLTQVITAS